MRRPEQKSSSRRPELQAAPGDLQIIQAFLNTVHLKEGTDDLSQPRGLSDWLARHGLLSGAAKLSKSDVGRALDVRDGIRALVSARGAADTEAIRRLDSVAQDARARVRFHDDGSNWFESGDLAEALGHLIALVVLNRREGLWPRLKVCADAECQTVFYDFSSNQTTKWCTPRCGNRLRAKSYRKGERYKSRPHHSPPRLPPIILEMGSDD